MSKIFEAKLRPVGNSLGVIVPNVIIRERGYKRGDMVHMVIPSHDREQRNDKLRKIAGIHSGKSGFERDKGDRF